MNFRFCNRCGGVFHAPRGAVLDAVSVCTSCVRDDEEAALARRPSPRLFGQDIDMYRWTDDPVPQARL